MGSVDIPPFMKERMKQDIQAKKSDIPPFLQKKNGGEEDTTNLEVGVDGQLDESVPTTSQLPLQENIKFPSSFDLSFTKKPVVNIAGVNVGINAPIQDISPIPEVANQETLTQQLQNRINTKTYTPEDVGVVAQSMDVSLPAASAYMKGDVGTGTVIHFNDVKAVKKEELKARIERVNSELGLSDSYEEVFASPDLAGAYINKIETLYQSKANQEADASTLKAQEDNPVLFSLGNIYVDKSQSRKTLNAAQQIKGIISNEIIDKISEDTTLTTDQKVQKIYSLVDSRDKANIKKAIDQRLSPLRYMIDVATGGKTSEDIDLLNANKAGIEFKLNRTIGEKINYNEALKRSITEEYLAKIEAQEISAEDETAKSYYAKRIADVESENNGLSMQLVSEKALYEKYPVLYKSAIANSVNEYNAIKSGNVVGFEDGGYEGVSLNEHLAAQGFDVKDQKVQDFLDGDNFKDYSFFGRPLKNISEVFTNTGKSIADFTPLRDKADILSEKIKAELFPTQVGATDELKLTTSASTAQNIANTTGQVLGQGLLQIGTAGIGRLAGLSKVAAANTAFLTSGSLVSYDSHLKESYDLPIETDAGRVAYAAINSGFEGAIEGLFPEAKLFQIPGFKDAAVQIAGKLSAGQLTDKLASELLTKAKNNAVNYLVKYGTNISKETAEEGLTSAFNSATKLIISDPNTNFDKAIEDVKNTVIQTAIGTSLIGGFGAYGDVRKERNVSAKSTIYNAAIYHDEALDAINLGFSKNLYNEKERDAKIAILNNAREAVNVMDKTEKIEGKTLKRPERELYVANLTAEAVLKGQKTGMDEVGQKAIDEKVANLQNQRQQILKGEVLIDDNGNITTPTTKPVQSEEVTTEVQATETTIPASTESDSGASTETTTPVLEPTEESGIVVQPPMTIPKPITIGGEQTTTEPIVTPEVKTEPLPTTEKIRVGLRQSGDEFSIGTFTQGEKNDFNQKVDLTKEERKELTEIEADEQLDGKSGETVKRRQDLANKIIERNGLSDKVTAGETTQPPTVESEADFSSKGGNKFVDEKGEPITVYHGTAADFTDFNSSNIETNYGTRLGKGFYFTDRKDVADFYGKESKGKAGATIVSSNINLKNPLDVNSVPEYREVVNKEKQRRSTNKVEADRLLSKGDNEILFEMGYDGVILRQNGKIDEIVVFSPEQIKILNKEKIQSENKPTSQKNKPVESEEVKDVESTTKALEDWTRNDIDIFFGIRDKVLLQSENNPEIGKIKNDAKNNGTFLKAPNGNKSKLSENDWAEVRSNDFKKNFGDWTKKDTDIILDDNGEPMKLYHGTAFNPIEGMFKDFNTEKNQFGYIFFTDNLDAAKQWARDKETSGNTEQHIVESFIKIKNPEIKDYKGEILPNSDIESFESRNDDGFILKDVIDTAEGKPIVNTVYAVKNIAQVSPINIKGNRRNLSAKEISGAYHKAKADGTNPELVKAVEEALSPKSETKPTQNEEAKATEVETPKVASFSTKARDLAARIRKTGITPDFLKVSDPNVKISGISDKQISEALATAIEFIADAVDAGVELAKAISDGFDNFKKVYTDNNEPFDEKKVKEGFTTYVGGQLGTGISNARTEQIREKYKLGGYVRNNATDAELQALADEAIANGYNIEDLIQQLENLIPPTGVENFILKKYIAGLEATFEKNPTDANLVPIERVVKALDKIGSIQSEAFRTRRGIVPIDDSLAGYFITEKELNLDAPLTEKQKETVRKEYKEISEAQKKWDEEKVRLNAKIIELQAQNELNKNKDTKKEPKTTPKKHEDFVNQRQLLKDKLKQQIADYKTAGNKLGITSDGGVESFIITAKMAKTIGEIVKSHVDEIGAKLAEVTKRTFDDVKDLFEGISEKDIHNVIAGNYAEQRPTKSVLAQNIFDLKTEAALVNKLDSLLQGEEPKTEKKKIQRNKEITALRNKIKDFERAKVSAANEIKKAAAEEERLIKAFEKEQEKDAKAKLKAEAQRQKEILRELERKTPEEIALQRYKTRIQNEIKKLEQDLKDGNFDTPVKLPPIKLDKEALDAKDKLVKLKTERQLRIIKQQQENMSVREKAIKGAAEILNIPRTLMTIVDYSAVLRQGLIQSISHPQFVLNARIEDGRIKVGGAGVDMIKAGVSQKVYDRWFFDLKETPRFALMEESGLGITDSTNPLLSAREEGFMSNLAERIPIIGKSLKVGNVTIPGTNLVKGSERSYSMFINKLRVDVFNRFADAMEERGLTFENSPEAFKQMAEYVNNSTGRGSLGKTLNRIAPLLNGIFFSPRLIASRLNMLTYLAQPRFYSTVPKEVRAAYFKDMAKFIGLGMLVIGLFSLNDGDDDDEDVTVEADPRSSDFGKIRQGNTRWDIWGGFQPFIRVAAQILTGERKSTTTGKIFELTGDDAFGKTRSDVAFAFGRGKLAPVPGMAVDLFSGRTAIGEKVLLDKWGKANEGEKEITIDRYLKEHLLPLTFTGLEESFKDKGVKSLFSVGVPSIFGVGVQTFTPSIGKGQTITVYKGGKKRDSTPEEYKKYEVERELSKGTLLKKYQKGGVYINKYGDVTTEITTKKRKYETLNDEEKKDLEGAISRRASYMAKKKLNLNQK